MDSETGDVDKLFNAMMAASASQFEHNLANKRANLRQQYPKMKLRTIERSLDLDRKQWEKLKLTHRARFDLECAQSATAQVPQRTREKYQYL